MNIEREVHEIDESVFVSQISWSTYSNSLKMYNQRQWTILS